MVAMEQNRTVSPEGSEAKLNPDLVNVLIDIVQKKGDISSVEINNDRREILSVTSGENGLLKIELSYTRNNDQNTPGSSMDMSLKKLINQLFDNGGVATTLTIHPNSCSGTVNTNLLFHVNGVITSLSTETKYPSQTANELLRRAIKVGENLPDK